MHHPGDDGEKVNSQFTFGQSDPSKVPTYNEWPARGEAFVKFIIDSLGKKPNAMIVPECGHHNRCVFTTREVFPVIFP